ncbi:MAG: hypothetical protein J7J86_00130 [Bacteroidales bacterium]|nr:hypothetical protein [Bacteroidales bacterium]
MKNIKTVLILSLLMISVNVNAQMHGRNRRNLQKGKQRIESLKIAYLTEKLMLTTEEAQNFWPVYNKYEKLRNKESKEFRENCFFNNLDDDSINKLSDKEASILVDKFVIHSQKMLDINKMYHKELKTVLPVKKILLLYKYDREFKRKLLERIRDNRNKRNM